MTQERIASMTSASQSNRVGRAEGREESQSKPEGFRLDS